eukprot:TRINITY_DN3163_c2_g1_i2.p1 TRINITY_DN3163_c2_g1~~TRINITY_DN3163_c2_g1_i2.p1  ORF type:complete len:126 (-),score=28.66 TRINITY_DN3163_c2_g1_i2:77-433(-)
MGSHNGVLAQNTTNFGSSLSSSTSHPFLAPNSVLTTQTAGIKHVGELSLRCRHCYLAVKDEQKFVMCTAKPRHYQAQKQPGKKYGMWVFSHATQGSSKRNNGKGSRHMWTQQSFRLDY